MLLAVLLALAVILALGDLIGTQVAGLAEEVPRYALTIQQKVDTVQQFVLSPRGDTREQPVVPQPAHVDVSAQAKPGAATARDAARRADGGGGASAKPSGDRARAAHRHPGCRTAVDNRHRSHRLDHFILLQREDLRDRMIRLFGASDLHRTTIAMNDAARRLSATCSPSLP